MGLEFWVHSVKPTSCSPASYFDEYSYIWTSWYLPFMFWNRLSKVEAIYVS
jgi:hypothetical protein